MPGGTGYRGIGPLSPSREKFNLSLGADTSDIQGNFLSKKYSHTERKRKDGPWNLSDFRAWGQMQSKADVS